MNTYSNPTGQIEISFNEENNRNASSLPVADLDLLKTCLREKDIPVIPGFVYIFRLNTSLYHSALEPNYLTDRTTAKMLGKSDPTLVMSRVAGSEVEARFLTVDGAGKSYVSRWIMRDKREIRIALDALKSAIASCWHEVGNDWSSSNAADCE